MSILSQRSDRETWQDTPRNPALSVPQYCLYPAEIIVDIEQAGEAEVDEMWSFVGKKGKQRWLWHAIDHHTGQVLAYVFGRRKDAVFLQLKALLEPFGLTQFYTDYWGAYR